MTSFLLADILFVRSKVVCSIYISSLYICRSFPIQIFHSPFKGRVCYLIFLKAPTIAWKILQDLWLSGNFKTPEWRTWIVDKISTPILPKLCFTNFYMLFRAVVKAFSHLNWWDQNFNLFTMQVLKYQFVLFLFCGFFHFFDQYFWISFVGQCALAAQVPEDSPLITLMAPDANHSARVFYVRHTSDISWKNKETNPSRNGGDYSRH